MRKIWNEETCREEAMKYLSRSEFCFGNRSAYRKAVKNGWINSYNWFIEKTKKWTEEDCYEEALKYHSKSEFEKNCGSAYNAALRNNWLKDYNWFVKIHKPNGFWTEQTCREEALKYKSRKEFENGNGSAYQIAWRNKWLDSYDWFDAPKTGKKWNEQTCYQEAKKYKTKGDFQKGSSGAYEASRSNGWLTNYDWLIETKKPNGYWNDESICREEAKKYQSRRDFEYGCSRAYKASVKFGWIDNFEWLNPKIKHCYWNEDTCREEALKYKTKDEFRRHCSSAYTIAWQNGWLDTYDWFIELSKPKGYWNEDTCREESKKYKTRSEFERRCSSAYGVARKNGWLDDYYWLVNQKLFTETGRWFNLYVYMWYELNSVYVGITIDPKQRDYQHHQKGCTVCNYANENNVEIPFMEIMEDHLTPQQAAYKEGWYIEEFKKNGFNIVNKAKAGSIGGLGSGKWNKKSCEREAKKYSTTRDFSKNSPIAYVVARKNGWLEKYDWLEEIEKPKGYWNEETCREEALKYHSRSEFRWQCKNGAYNVANQNKWLDSYDWFERPPVHNKKWTRDTCYQEALKYKTKGTFREGSSMAYKISIQNDWYKDYTWLDFEYGKWNEENCRKEALLYSSKKEFRDCNNRVYCIARRKGWLKDYEWLEKDKNPRCKWNEENCREEARKYNTKAEFRKNSPGAYNAAYKKHWIDKFDWFEQKQKPNGYWTEEKCREEALKYHSKSEFKYACNGAYRTAIKKGWLKDYNWFSRPITICKWTHETCKQESLKYKSRSEFENKCSSAYDVARRNGWLDEFVWLEQKCKPNGYWNEQTCQEEAMKYTTKKEFRELGCGAYAIACKNGWISKYYWLKGECKPNGYWTEKTCREEALKYKSRTEFEKNSRGAYAVARRNSWLDDYDWLILRFKPKGYWTKETCREEAKKYKTRGDFNNGNKSAYGVSWKNGWLDEFFPLD